MSYRLYAFNEVLLPFRMAEDDLSTATVDSTIVNITGQAWDAWETTRNLPRRHSIQHNGIYVGDGTVLARLNLTEIVTETCDNIIVGNEGQAVRAQVDALKAQIGVQGTLYRLRESDSVLQWKTARLLAVRHRQAVDDIATATIDSSFESTMRAWRGVTQQSAVLAYTGRGYLYFENNGDLPIDNATLTITASSTITNIMVELAGGVSWTWTGSLTSGQVLTIDCGALTVLRGTTDQYSGLALNSAHTAIGWLPIPVGANNLIFTGNGAATITLRWYEQFA